MRIPRSVMLLAVAMHWLGFADAPAPAQEPGKGPFERFRYSFFEDQNSARDGLDVPALLALAGEERRRAEDMLLAFLPDTRAVIGLGELRSQRAAARLLQIFNEETLALRASKLTPTDDWSPYGLIFVTKALWQVQPDARALQVMIDILTTAKLDVAREEAAGALAAFRDPGAIPPLVRALDDPESQVRHHAARTLLAIHGLRDEADIMKADKGSLIIRIMDENPARRESAKLDLLAAIKGKPIATE